MARKELLGLLEREKWEFQKAKRTRTRTNTNRKDTEANAAGRRGVRVCSANGTCKNQGAWVAKSLTKSEELVDGAHSGNA